MKLIKNSNCYSYDSATGKIYNSEKGIEIKNIIENKVMVIDEKVLKEFERIYDPEKGKYKINTMIIDSNLV